MLQEQGRVVAVESGAVWVETIQKSVCGSCAAKSGCGQRLLASFGAQANYLKVLLPDDGAANKHNVGDMVTIGLPEQAVVKASLLTYLLPLVVFVFFTAGAHALFNSDPLSIVAGIVGLLVGGALVRLCNFRQRSNPDFEPQIIE